MTGPLHGMLPFCQPVICGRTNLRCQMSFLSGWLIFPRTRQHSGAWLLSGVHTWLPSFLSLQSFPSIIYLSVSSTRWKFCRERGDTCVAFWILLNVLGVLHFVGVQCLLFNKMGTFSGLKEGPPLYSSFMERRENIQISVLLHGFNFRPYATYQLSNFSL